MGAYKDMYAKKDTISTYGGKVVFPVLTHQWTDNEKLKIEVRRTVLLNKREPRSSKWNVKSQ